MKPKTSRNFKEKIMRVSPSDFSSLVSTREEAEQVIANLLLGFASTTASERLTDESREQHRTEYDVARQTASNLLRSFEVRKYRW
jgi:hypothetical protein